MFYLWICLLSNNKNFKNLITLLFCFTIKSSSGQTGICGPWKWYKWDDICYPHTPHKEQRHEKTNILHMQISFTVTTKLISAFVFATGIVQSLFFLQPKFPVSCHLLWLHSPVWADLDRNHNISFLMMRLKYVGVATLAVFSVTFFQFFSVLFALLSLFVTRAHIVETIHDQWRLLTIFCSILKSFQKYEGRL